MYVCIINRMMKISVIGCFLSVIKCLSSICNRFAYNSISNYTKVKVYSFDYVT
jgi:hypothetical protein